MNTSRDAHPAKALDPVDQQAHDWFARLNGRKPSSADRAAFAAWRLADPAHAQAYERTVRVWEEAAAVGQSAAIKHLRTQALGAPARGTQSRPGLMAAALVAGVICAVAALGWSQWIPLSQTDPAAVVAQYATQIGERRNIVLDDGSALILDTASEVSVLITKTHRTATLLEGRARFSVAHDPTRAFTVTTNSGGTITALGTQFDVRVTNAGVNVVLLEGAVRVASAGDSGGATSVDLQPGQMVDVANDVVLTPAPIDLAIASSWVEGRLVFRGAPLSEALAALNRTSKTKISLQDPELGALLLRGTFNAGDTHSFVQTVTVLFPIDALTDDEGNIVLVRRASAAG